MALGAVEGADDFGDGGGVGGDFGFFDAVEGFGADGGTAGEFGLRQADGPAAVDEFAGEADAKGEQGGVITGWQIRGEGRGGRCRRRWRRHGGGHRIRLRVPRRNSCHQVEVLPPSSSCLRKSHRDGRSSTMRVSPRTRNCTR